MRREGRKATASSKPTYSAASGEAAPPGARGMNQPRAASVAQQYAGDGLEQSDRYCVS